MQEIVARLISRAAQELLKPRLSSSISCQTSHILENGMGVPAAYPEQGHVLCFVHSLSGGQMANHPLRLSVQICAR